MGRAEWDDQWEIKVEALRAAALSVSGPQKVTATTNAVLERAKAFESYLKGKE